MLFKGQLYKSVAVVGDPQDKNPGLAVEGLLPEEVGEFSQKSGGERVIQKRMLCEDH